MSDSFIIKKWRSQVKLSLVVPEVDLFSLQTELILLELVTETYLASFAMAVQ